VRKQVPSLKNSDQISSKKEEKEKEKKDNASSHCKKIKF